MADEFTNNIPEKFPNTSNKDPVERPWDVPEPSLGSSLKKANRLLEEVNRIRGEVEKIIEMLRVMEEYMKERIK